MRRGNDKPPTDKCLMTWTAGCHARGNLGLAIKEVQATQALNTRTTKEKTYHLIVSFRPEDKDKLTPEAFKAIEARFASALGLTEHQRVCGVHTNTDNVHMHIAYNLIHPEKLNRVEPWRDYQKMKVLRRELEQEYGLAPEPGQGKAQETPNIGTKAADMEAHTGQQSFEGYAQEQGSAIMAQLEVASSWEDVHMIFAKHGLEIKPKGAGLAVKNRHGKQAAKASVMHRDLSMKKLVAKFGPYVPPKGQMPDSEIRYGAKPLQREGDRAELWQQFQLVKEQREAALEASRQKWADYREYVQKTPIGKRTRASMLRLVKIRERQERKNFAALYPPSWKRYLQQEAEKGNEQAIIALRSRKQKSKTPPQKDSPNKGKGLGEW